MANELCLSPSAFNITDFYSFIMLKCTSYIYVSKLIDEFTASLGSELSLWNNNVIIISYSIKYYKKIIIFNQKREIP